MKEPVVPENSPLLLGSEDIFVDSKRKSECIHMKRGRKPLNCIYSLERVLVQSSGILGILLSVCLSYDTGSILKEQKEGTLLVDIEIAMRIHGSLSCPWMWSPLSGYGHISSEACMTISIEYTEPLIRVVSVLLVWFDEFFIAIGRSMMYISILLCQTTEGFAMLVHLYLLAYSVKKCVFLYSLMHHIIIYSNQLYHLFQFMTVVSPCHYEHIT